MSGPIEQIINNHTRLSSQDLLLIELARKELSDLKKALKDIQEDIKFSSCGVCHRVDLRIADLIKDKE